MNDNCEAHHSNSTAHQPLIISPDGNAETEQLTGEAVLSKRQQKKLAKYQLRISNRTEKRKEVRERKKFFRRERQAEAVISGVPVPQKKVNFHMMSASKCKLRVAIDLAYEDKMLPDPVSNFDNDTLLRKTLRQTMMLYASNRRAPNPMQLFLVNFRGRTRDLFQSVTNVKSWDINILQESLADLWSPDQIVYLTAESENELTRLENSKVYVIGGLIDHNNRKGLCHSIAVKAGWGHARLPVDENIVLKTRKVLTINQVFDILLRVSQGESWANALIQVIPKRKGPTLRQESPPSAEAELTTANDLSSK